MQCQHEYTIQITAKQHTVALDENYPKADIHLEIGILRCWDSASCIWSRHVTLHVQLRINMQWPNHTSFQMKIISFISSLSSLLKSIAGQRTLLSLCAIWIQFFPFPWWRWMSSHHLSCGRPTLLSKFSGYPLYERFGPFVVFPGLGQNNLYLLKNYIDLDF